MTDTVVDKFLRLLKNNKVVAGVIVVSVGLIGASQVMEAVDKIWSTVHSISNRFSVQTTAGTQQETQEELSRIDTPGHPGNFQAKFVVGTDGDGQYPSISDALKAGITDITVAPGIYHECLNVTQSDVTIRGSGRRSTIIDGGTHGPALSLNADRFRAENISFQTTPGSGTNYGAVFVGESCSVSEFEFLSIEVNQSDNTAIEIGTNYPCHHGLIKSSWVGGADGDAISIAAGSYRIDVIENVIWDSAGRAVTIQAGAHHCRVILNEISRYFSYTTANEAILDVGEDNEVKENIYLPDNYTVGEHH